MSLTHISNFHISVWSKTVFVRYLVTIHKFNYIYLVLFSLKYYMKFITKIECLQSNTLASQYSVSSITFCIISIFFIVPPTFYMEYEHLKLSARNKPETLDF
ncbi:hypothetical protein LMOSA_10441 [Listeria monocytogenes str. Scott A]|nr:hypothetical protein LMOSA_10441 [Listeria monocytogenes str. Scott A]GAM91971.1 conserved protein of unknown function [Listeria monocytogenes]GAM94132.1 conserved protein of unknown function [Listeria monocytogenes]